MSAVKKAKNTRRRYTAEEKSEIAAFIEKHDTENGRGGKSAAVKQYGVSPISIASWSMSKTKVAKTAIKPSPTGKKRGRKAGSKNLKATVSKESGFSAKLKELESLAGQITRAQASLAELHTKFKAMKNAL